MKRCQEKSYLRLPSAPASLPLGTGWCRRFSCEMSFLVISLAHIASLPELPAITTSQIGREVKPDILDPRKMQVGPGRNFPNHFKAKIHVTRARP